jgi:hypothetical protein
MMGQWGDTVIEIDGNCLTTHEFRHLSKPLSMITAAGFFEAEKQKAKRFFADDPAKFIETKTGYDDLCRRIEVAHGRAPVAGNTVTAVGIRMKSAHLDAVFARSTAEEQIHSLTEGYRAVEEMLDSAGTEIFSEHGRLHLIAGRRTATIHPNGALLVTQHADNDSALLEFLTQVQDIEDEQGFPVFLGKKGQFDISGYFNVYELLSNASEKTLQERPDLKGEWDRHKQAARPEMGVSFRTVSQGHMRTSANISEEKKTSGPGKFALG